MSFISVIRVGIIMVRWARRLVLIWWLHYTSCSLIFVESVGKLDRLIAVSCLVAFSVFDYNSGLVNLLTDLIVPLTSYACLSVRFCYTNIVSKREKRFTKTFHRPLASSYAFPHQTYMTGTSRKIREASNISQTVQDRVRDTSVNRKSYTLYYDLQ